MQTLTDIIILPYFIYIDLYANRLVKSMPKIGTFQSHGDRCNFEDGTQTLATVDLNFSKFLYMRDSIVFIFQSLKILGIL